MQKSEASRRPTKPGAVIPSRFAHCFAFTCTLVLALALTTLSTRAQAATFTVTSTADSGPGTLRDAIHLANTNPVGDPTALPTIGFNLSGSGTRVIAPLTPLPGLTNAYLIDATTQPGYVPGGAPLIELTGTNLTSGSGLILKNGAGLRALAITAFPDAGLRLEGRYSGVDSSYLGLRPNGSPRGNLYGILLYDTTEAIVGSSRTNAVNVISGNRDTGLYVFNGTSNTIGGNLIGTAPDGLSAFPNTNHGVLLYNSSSNLVGATPYTSGNLISGNRGTGLYLYGAATTGNLVTGNRIGTSLTGQTRLPNLADGISLWNAPANTIATSNLVSGNGLSGISLSGPASVANYIAGNTIGPNLTGTLPLSNTLAGITLFDGPSGNRIGGATPAERNQISGNGQDGVFLTTNTFANTIAGNLIGLTANGLEPLPNRYSGIALSQSSSNLIGGPELSARNIISGNAYYGILLSSGAASNTIQNNFIGTDLSGQNASANNLSGIRIESPANEIRANLISGNGQDGIYLYGPGASSNRITANLIGTRSTGTTALPNHRGGIGLSAAPRNTIGGTSPADANTISANLNSGLYLLDRATAHNQILGNRIGTDPSGTLNLGNAYDGINSVGAVSNTIGGLLPGAGNLISDNRNGGIYLAQSSWNTIQANTIGTAADTSSPLGNAMAAVECDTQATNNVIGGSLAGANTIACSPAPYAGVRIRTGALRNRITYNRIFGHGGPAIDLGTAGQNSNDTCDTDSGANALQNHPDLTAAVTSNLTAVDGAFTGATYTRFLVQLFASPACPTNGFGQGFHFLADLSLTNAAACFSEITARLPAVPPGWVITATATDPNGNTSEFSPCLTPAPAPALTCQIANHQLTLTWPASPFPWALLTANSLDPTVPWTLLANTPPLTPGSFSLPIPTTGHTNAYFRLLLH